MLNPVGIYRDQSRARSLSIAGDINPAATQIERCRRLGICPGDHVVVQTVVDEPAVPSRLDQVGVLEDLQVVRDRDNSRIEGLGEAADRKFTAAKRIDNAEPEWISQRLETFGTVVCLKDILLHRSPRADRPARA